MNKKINEKGGSLKNTHTIYIPERFSLAVERHVFSNYMGNSHFFHPPLFLAIEGSPGQGKTHQVIAVCNSKNVRVKYVSASTLSGNKEGQSRDILNEIYKEATELYQDGVYVCILIDDFHLGISTTDEKVNKTVNSNLLTSALMNLADFDNSVRIPIVFTGNDFSKIYPALLRDGRAEVFYWEPSLDEKIEIVGKIFAPILSDNTPQKLLRFVSKYKSQNIAFFSQLINDIRNNTLDCALQNIEFISAENLELLDELVSENFNQISFRQLEKLANKRAKIRRRFFND